MNLRILVQSYANMREYGWKSSRDSFAGEKSSSIFGVHDEGFSTMEDYQVKYLQGINLSHLTLH